MDWVSVLYHSVNTLIVVATVVGCYIIIKA